MKRYSENFKKDAVEKMKDKSVRLVSEEMGVTEVTLYEWKKRATKVRKLQVNMDELLPIFAKGQKSLNVLLLATAVLTTVVLVDFIFMAWSFYH